MLGVLSTASMIKQCSCSTSSPIAEAASSPRPDASAEMSVV
jgi:hypothetical protein